MEWSGAVWVLCLGLPLAVLALRLLWRWRKFVTAVQKLPMLKLRFYHLLGHAQGLLYLRTLKVPLPHHVYDFMLLNGYSYLFRTKSLAAAWTFCFPFVQIHRADSVKTILSHSTELRKGFTYKFLRPWIGNGLLISDGSKWRTRRKLLTPAFHFDVLQDFVSVFAKQARILERVLEGHAEDECVDVVPLLTKCSFDIMCETMLGVETHAQTNPSCQYLNSVNILTNALFERMMNPLLWPDFLFKMSPLGRKFFEHARLAKEFTHKIIRERKREGVAPSRKKRALLDLLLEDREHDLTEDDIREEIDTFTFEGHDTTAMALSWALYLIGLHPDVQEKIREEVESVVGDEELTTRHLKEMKYLECVIKESLRLYPPVPLFGRYIQEDLEFQDVVVPRGSTCMVFPYFLHRDPDVFLDPDKFDPDRFESGADWNPFAYVPFSAGPRNCIGQRFAVLEEKAVLATLLRKYTFVSLDPRDRVHVVNQIVLRPVHGLRLRIRHRGCPSPDLRYYPSTVRSLAHQ